MTMIPSPPALKDLQTQALEPMQLDTTLPPPITQKNERTLESLPTSPKFDRMMRIWNTSLDLEPQQVSAVRRAERMTYRNEAQIKRAGRGEEYQEFVDSDGGGTLAELDTDMSRLTEPVFDLLSIGNYTIAGGVRELLRTGSAWEAFKQATTEFGDALPWLEVDGAAKSTFSDVINDHSNMNPLASAAIGFVLDIVLDPVTWIPGGAVVKYGGKIGDVTGASKALRTGSTAFKGTEWGRYLRAKFMSGGDIMVGLEESAATYDDVANMLSGSAKIAPDAAGDYYTSARAKRDLVTEIEKENAARQVMDLAPYLTMQQHYVIGAALDQPELLPRIVDDLISQNVFKQGDKENILKAVDAFKKHHDELFKSLDTQGFIDPAFYRENYMAGIAPVLKETSRKLSTLENVAKTRKSGLKSYWSGFLERRSTANQLSRVEEGLPTELHAGANIAARTFYQRKMEANAGFIRGVLNDVGIPITDAMETNGKGVMAPVLKDSEAMDTLRKSLPEGWDVMEIKRYRPMTPAEAKAAEKSVKDGMRVPERIMETEAAYVVPTAIRRDMEQLDSFFALDRNPEETGKFFETAQKYTNFWRGYTVFSLGYHTRNLVSEAFYNWIAGVGMDYKAWIRGEKTFSQATFLGRHQQALAAQISDESLTKLPEWARKRLGVMTGDTRGVSAKKLTAVNPATGNAWTFDEILQAAKESGFMQTTTKLDDFGVDAQARMLREFGDTRSVWQKAKDVARGKVRPTRGVAVEETDAIGSTMREVLATDGGAQGLDRVRDILGNDGAMLRGNRALGMIIENNSKLALFIDRIEKGETVIDAARAVKKYHYDPRLLTEWEQRYMRLLIPFYGWMKFNTPLMLQSLIESPGKYARIPKLQEFIENMDGEKIDVETPDYFRELAAVQLPVIREQRPLYLTPDLPFLDMNRFNKTDLISNLNPWIVTAYEQVSGQTAFTGAPLERYAGEPSKEIGSLSKRTVRFIEGVVPGFQKYVTTPARQIAAGTSEYYVLSELTGMKVRGVDVPRLVRAKAYQRANLSQQFLQKMRREQEEE